MKHQEALGFSQHDSPSLEPSGETALLLCLIECDRVTYSHWYPLPITKASLVIKKECKDSIPIEQAPVNVNFLIIGSGLQ